MMLWRKCGRIYAPPLDNSWRHQNAICPTPFKINEQILRIFCTMCDPNNIGRVGYIDVDINDPSKVFSISSNPILDVGRSGCFDDNGIGPISIVEHSGKIFLYCVGFQLGVKIPYFMFGGLAISEDGGHTFRKYSESPVLDRIGSEIFARCGICVLFHENKFKMWYIGSTESGWTEYGGKKLPLYTMRYLESEDGIHWPGEGIICMSFANPDEHGFGRPFVWIEDGVYKQYYSIRTYSHGYYLGYAESYDGIHWDRMDHLAGIENSFAGWDSINTCYASLYRHGNSTYMFYNGNGMGKSGFGYAELIS